MNSPTEGCNNNNNTDVRPSSPLPDARDISEILISAPPYFPPEPQDEYRDSEGSVIAADFYHASELLPLSDEEVTERVHRTYLSSCVPEFRRAQRAVPWKGCFFMIHTL